MRTVSITVDAPAVNQEEIAKILAYYITGGDPVGYLARLAEKQQRETSESNAQKGG